MILFRFTELIYKLTEAWLSNVNCIKMFTVSIPGLNGSNFILPTAYTIDIPLDCRLVMHNIQGHIMSLKA